MKFIYKPEGVEPREWPFAPNKMLSPEAEVIERRTGLRFAEFTGAVTEGSMLALHGLLYVLLKREEPTLKWEQVVFSLADVDFDLDDEEKASAVTTLERVATERSLTDDEQDLLTRFRAEVPVVVDEVEDEVVEAGPGLPPPVGDSDPKDD